MSDFASVLRAAGLRPRDVVADGTIHRCATEGKPGKRNGWYVLHPDGHGAWGDWASGSGEPLGTWRDERATLDPAALARAQALQVENRQREREKRIAGIHEARRIWSESSDYRVHPYFEGKGLGTLGCQHFRLWQGTVSHKVGDDERGRPVFERVTDRWLVVPMYWRGRVVSLQRISASGLKLNLKDAPTNGACLELGRPRYALTIFCEGPATGLALYQAVRSARVVICFVAGNLLNVVQELKPSGSVVIAADNDYGTLAKRGFNPGIEHARNAASLIDCGVAFPQGIEGTDWADYLKEVGEGAARKVERLVLAQARYVTAKEPAA